MSCINVIYGAGGAGSWGSETDGPRVGDVLQEFGVTELDTARIYPGSEERVGKRGMAARFKIDTKHPGGFSEGGATSDNVLEVAKTSFELLQTDQVDAYYLHAPDRKTPLEDTLKGINELYQQGRFKRFGLSNFLANEVEDVIRVAKEKGYVQPAVYQGSYSAFARKQEEEVLPVLRKHGIAFNAYSPLAGGFVTKTAKDLELAVGRFDPSTKFGQLYVALYKKPAFLAALDDWDRISTESGIPKAELANRWVAYNSALKAEYGDGIIIGTRTLEQLRGTLESLKRGPLPDKVAQQIDQIWDKIKDVAGLDMLNN